MTEHVKVELEISPEMAMALAQLCKRMGLSDCRANAVDDEEAYQMVNALADLSSALAQAGFSPR